MMSASDTSTPSTSLVDLFPATMPVMSPFEQSLNDWAAAQPNVSSLLAWHRWLDLGLPTSKLEAYKYVDLRPVRSTAWQISRALTPAPSPSKIDSYMALPLNDSIRIVVVDGQFRPQLSSDLSGLPLKLQPIDPATDANEPCLAQETDGLVLLNRALSVGGQLLWIPRDTAIAPVIEVLYLTTRAAEGHCQTPRLHVELEPGASATVVVHWVGQTDVSYFVNGLVTVRLEDKAHLRLIQRRAASDKALQLLTLQAQQFGKSRLDSWSMASKGVGSRLAQTIELKGEGAECHLTGLSVGHGQSEIHQRVAVLHEQPNCHSTQLFKALAGGQARTEFDGIIKVSEGATGTDAQQLSKNLLLSATAKAFARPWLQIDTDDVTCSHGATVGQLNEAEVFYLISRGIPAAQARALCTLGFARQVLDGLGVPALEPFFRKQITCSLTSMVG